MNAPQESGELLELPLPARYLRERALSLDVAAANGIGEEPPMLALPRLKLPRIPPQYLGATHALRISCREFDGTLHPDAEQVVLFGRFIEEDTGEIVQRVRRSAKGVSNRVSWYGNSVDPKLVVYCESRLKALVTSRANPGWLCAGLNGVDGWSAGKDKEDRPVLAANLFPPIDTRDLPAVLLPDSSHHKAVRRAMAGLRAAIAAAYRSVTLCKLPKPTDGRTDWGADDVAAAFGVQALQLFVREEREASDVYTLQSAVEIARQPAPPWVVRRWIPTDDLTLIVGETSCGKTFLTMDLMLAVASGKSEWFGNAIKSTGPVVHISLETRGMPLRLRAYEHEHGGLPADYHYLSGNVTLADDYERLIRSMEALHPVIIAVDTVNRAMGGGDENSSADMGAFVRAAERLLRAFPGCAVLLIHHLGKNAERGARGHSSLKAAVGTELLITNDGVGTVSLEKQRDGITGLRLGFKLKVIDLEPDEDGPVTSCVVLPTELPVEVTNGRPSEYEVYCWIHDYMTATHPGRLVTKSLLKEEFARIVPKGRITRAEFLAAWEAIAEEGRWVEKPATGQPTYGGAYRLLPLLDRKYAK